MNTNKVGNRILWLDGLKLFACICIMISHFCSAFIELDKNMYAVENISPVFIMLTRVFKFFLDGEFWVRVFCMVAGYLAATKVIHSIKEAVVAIVMRYFRFAVPFLSLSVIVLCIERTIGFYAEECGNVMGATWLGGHYTTPIAIKDIFRLIFLFDHTLDTPLWTIIPIFWGSCIIYVIGMFLQKFRISERYYGFVFLLVFFVSIVKYDINSLCISSCILGAAIYWTKDMVKISGKYADLGVVLLIIMISFLHENIIDLLIYKGIDVPERLKLGGYGYELYGALLLVFLCHSCVLKRVLSLERMISLSGRSFAIYILHMPILASFSSWFCLLMLQRVNYDANVVANLGVYFVVVMLSSYMYTKIIDSWQNRFLIKIKKSLMIVVKG